MHMYTYSITSVLLQSPAYTHTPKLFICYVGLLSKKRSPKCGRMTMSSLLFVLL
jgi:hypothetical protein